MKNYWLYVLKLEQEKYYIGVTSRNVSRRLAEHEHGFMGATWTKKYKPLKILDKKNLGPMSYKRAEMYETRVTMKYMQKYGVDNVRGGLLTYGGSYIHRFGRYFKDDDYASLEAISIMTAVIIALGVLWYLK